MSAVRARPGPDQVSLRLAIGAGTLTVLMAAVAAGAQPPWWEQLGLVGLALLTAVWPDSVAGIALLVGSAYVWAGTPETLSALVLVAAAGMVLAHLAALVAAQGPATMAVDGAQVLLWATRGVTVWLAAPAVLLLVVLMQDAPVDRLTFALGLLTLAAVAVAAAQWIGSRTEPS